jgi:AraC family transcriptional regulator
MAPTTSSVIEAAVARRRHTSTVATIGARMIANGPGWRILDVLCTCGHDDVVRDEEHSHFSLAMVLGGAFEYRGRRGSAQLAPGSILIGKAGEPFRCWHSYGAGDRCLAVQFEQHAFDELTAGLGADNCRELPVAIPVTRHTAGLFAFAELLVDDGLQVADGLEMATRLADRILTTAHQVEQPNSRVRAADMRRILELARWIETDPSADYDIEGLALRAGLSKYHFIRSFKTVVGMPPYAFITRARLRDACTEIARSDRRIIDVALGAGFSDLSTFNHLFKRHFACAPQALRLRSRNRHAHALFELEHIQALHAPH